MKKSVELLKRISNPNSLLLLFLCLFLTNSSNANNNATKHSNYTLLICPIGNTVPDANDEVCSGNGTGTFAMWQDSLNTANPLDATQDPDNSGSIIYSSVLPVVGATLADNFVPTGTTIGMDFCSAQDQSTSAYLYCDTDGSGTVSLGDVYTLLSSFTLTVFPAIQNPIITDNSCQITITGFCASDTITLSDPSLTTGTIFMNGTNEVVYRARTGDVSGTVSITITSGIPNTLCTYFDTIVTPDCPLLVCQEPVLVESDTGAVCASGGIADLVEWQNEVIDSNQIENSSEAGQLNSIVFSNVTPVPGSEGQAPIEKLPTGIFEGPDFCVPEIQEVSAYLYCSQTGNESYELISTYTLTVYPPALTTEVITDGSSCGNPKVILKDTFGAVCDSLMGICTSNDSIFYYDFSMTDIGMALVNAPDGCPFPPADSLPCSGCRSIQLIDDPCSCTDVNNYLEGGTYFFHEVIEISSGMGESWNLTTANQLYDDNESQLVLPQPLTDNGDGTYTISAYIINTVDYTADFTENGGAVLSIEGKCELPNFSADCPADTDLGTFNCLTLNDIPDCPTTLDHVTVEPYNLMIDPQGICNTIVVICDDGDETPNFCQGEEMIFRRITVFDDLDESGALEDGEPFETCVYTINIILDENVPVINEAPGILDEVICLTDPMGSCPDQIFTDDIEDHLLLDTLGNIIGTNFSDPITGMTWTFDAPTAVDDCGMVKTEVDSEVGEGACATEITLYWFLLDNCDNESEYIQVILFQDCAAPNITTPAMNVSFECSNNNITNELNDWLNNNGGAEATDNCDTLTWSNNFTMLSPGTCNAETTVTFTALDTCGNIANTTATFTVTDNTAPIVTNPTEGIDMLTCLDIMPDTIMTLIEFQEQGGTAVDDCSTSLTFTLQQSTNGDFCPNGNPFTITRTYLVTDDCGNTGSDANNEQIFQYQESQNGPVITSILPDSVITCSDQANPMESDVIYTTDCNLGATVIITGPEVIGDPNCLGTIYRYTYTVTDECQRTDVATRDFIIENQGLTITPPPFDLMLDCNNPDNNISVQNHMNLATATSFCNLNTTITYQPTNFDNLLCGEEVQVTLTATDACGRIATAVSTIVLQDITAPVFTVIPPPVCDTIPCSADTEAWYNHWLEYMLDGLGATDDCAADVTIAAANNSLNTTCINGSAITIVNFVASDDCGNSSTVTGAFTIVDQPPVFNSVPAEVTIPCGETPVFDDPLISDDCGTIDLDFEDEIIGDNCTGMIIRTWIAADNCNNSTTAQSIINFTDMSPPNASLSGVISTEYLEPVSHVSVNLEGSSSFNQETVTDASGQFTFSGLFPNNNYTVTPYSDENLLNGVSTYDLVLISKHILQTQMLDSPYKMIAADINHSGSITTFDLVELRKVILFIDENFESNTSWRFVEGDYIFPNPANPFASTFPEESHINGLSLTEIHDFVAIKTGDVNQSAQTSALLEMESRNGLEPLTLATSNVELSAGEEYEVAFTATQEMNLSGFQFTLNFDLDQLEFMELKKADLNNLDASNFGFSKLNQGSITSSWYNSTPAQISAEKILFKLKFTAKKKCILSEVLQLNSRFTKAEAYDADLQTMDVQLFFKDSNSKENKSNNTFALYENKPNPFDESTTIGFQLPEASRATLRIYDMSGKELYRMEGDYEMGYNEMTIDKGDVGVSGVLYYQLITDEFEAARKMVLR